MKKIKLEELKNYNGKDGKQAYITYNGKIYDVTKSKHWKNGLHMTRHHAGEDLTDYLNLAPHGEEVFKRLEMIGYLAEEKNKKLKDKDVLRNLYRKYHPHPMLIHFPMGLIYFSAFMYALHVIFINKTFELTALYALLGAFITTFPAALAGLASWIINYNMKWTNIFRNKIIFTILFIITSFATILIRLVFGDLMLYDSPIKYFYLLLYLANLPIISFVAYNGGKITWS